MNVARVTVTAMNQGLMVGFPFGMTALSEHLLLVRPTCRAAIAAQHPDLCRAEFARGTAARLSRSFRSSSLEKTDSKADRPRLEDSPLSLGSSVRKRRRELSQARRSTSA